MTNYANYGSTSIPFTSNDNDTRFAQLSDAIGNNIFNINAGSITLERILKQIGTSRDNPSLRDNIHGTQQNTNLAIFKTTDLVKKSANISRNGHKQQKLRTERLQKEFKEAVERYSSMQMQLADQIRATYSFKSPVVPVEVSENALLLENETNKIIDKQQVINNLEFEQDLARERDEAIQQLEEDILDVNQIFRDLGAMVHEQGETINTIEANIDRTYHNVEAGTHELSQAAVYQKSYRKKICCFAVIIAIAAVVLVIVLVATLKTK